MISGLNLNTGLCANSSLKNSSRAAELTRNIIIGHVSLLVFGVYACDDAVYVIDVHVPANGIAIWDWQALSSAVDLLVSRTPTSIMCVAWFTEA